MSIDKSEGGGDFFGNLENQMEGAQGGDGFTDSERRAINAGIRADDDLALNALARRTRELQAEQNPNNLPLIFKRGRVINVLRSSGVVDYDWEVLKYDRVGYVDVFKKDPNDKSHEGARALMKTLTFKEFYKLNPPDETCQNAEYLEEYKKSL